LRWDLFAGWTVLDSAFRNGWRRGGLAERGRFALWLSVFMGAGVLCYFAPCAEPVA
jgi:hypothetical protein